MFFKGRNFGICPVANQTVVWPLPTVCSHVKLEVRRPGKGSAADQAAVRLMYLVGLQVLLEGRRLLEGFPAHRALEVPLT